MGLSIVEQIEIDGEGWEIERHEGDAPHIWTAHGLNPENRGCIVTAYNRDALLETIPKAREKHRISSIAIGMEHAIVRAFKDVLTSNMAHGYKKADDYAERQAAFASIRAACADLWPWVFDEKKDASQ